MQPWSSCMIGLTLQCSSRRSRDPAGQSWVKEGSWAAWAVQGTVPSRTGSRVDKMRHELKIELRSALRHAYLGPQ